MKGQTNLWSLKSRIPLAAFISTKTLKSSTKKFHKSSDKYVIRYSVKVCH